MLIYSRLAQDGPLYLLPDSSGCRGGYVGIESRRRSSWQRKLMENANVEACERKGSLRQIRGSNLLSQINLPSTSGKRTIERSGVANEVETVP